MLFTSFNQKLEMTAHRIVFSIIFAAKHTLQHPQIGEKETKNVPIMYQIAKNTKDIFRPYQSQVPHFLQLAGLAAGVASSILGGVSSANAAKKAEQMRIAQDARNEALFNRRYNQSYLDSAAGRNAIRQATDYAKTITKRAEGAAAVTGGTDAAVAQAKESANKMIGDTMGNLAAQDTARQAQAEETFARQQEQSTAQQMATQQQRANAIAQASAGASNALIQGATMLDKSVQAPSTRSAITPDTLPSTAKSDVAPTSTPSFDAAGMRDSLITDYAKRHGEALFD